MSASILNRLKKRQHAKLELPGDGGTVYVRTPTKGEQRIVRAFLGDGEERELIRDGLSLAFVLVDDNGNPLCPRNENESNEDYGKRASEFFADIPPETELLVMDKVQSLVKVPSLESVAKN